MFNKVTNNQQEAHDRLAAQFLEATIPPINQWIMRVFPFTVKWFDYSLATGSNWQHLTLVRKAYSKHPKVIARNFDPS